MVALVVPAVAARPVVVPEAVVRPVVALVPVVEPRVVQVPAAAEQLVAVRVPVVAPAQRVPRVWQAPVVLVPAASTPRSSDR